MSFNCDIPASPTLQQDDADTRITRWDFQPGASTGWHEHGWPYVVVMLTDAQMHVHDGEQVNVIARRAGESYARPAGVRHDVKNGGREPMAFVEIEMKRLPG
jgi:mannose-6-phosphate isomerase-like protein (cupin superfamily)